MIAPNSKLAVIRAKDELRLFALGLTGGVLLLLVCLFVLPGGVFLFIGLATRVEYAVIGALVVDFVIYNKEPDLPRRLPATAFALGAVLPMVLVTLWVLTRFMN